MREAEKAIDSVYLSNPLVGYSFGEAAWYFLAHCEERLVVPVLKEVAGETPRDLHSRAALADEVLNHAKWPLRWLAKSCPRGDSIPAGYNGDAYGAAWELSKLSSEYLSFESAFTYASLGLATLQIDNRRIIVSGPFRDDTRYEAYDRMGALDEQAEVPVDPGRIVELVRPGLQVDADLFSYPLNPRIVQETLTSAEPRLAKRFRMPGDWMLSGYSLTDYAAVAKCLWAISAIHYISRVMAVSQGCMGLGYSRALVVMGVGELRRRLARYAGLKEERVRAIVSEMTYGRGTIEAPDPAFQPLVELTDDRIAWAPTLLLSNAFERNLLVLLNRNPDAKKAYARLSTQKEELLRSRLIGSLQDLGLRFWNGEVPGWREAPDVDLAIISDETRTCLLLELKSFIAPAEPREIRDRSEEISRGIAQVKTRRDLAKTQGESLRRSLGVSTDYRFGWAVASETFIGAGWVQDESVPVVRAAHLASEIRETRNLENVRVWVESRAFLPVEGRDYETVPVTVQVGEWTMDWHGIRGLREVAGGGEGPTRR